MLSWDLCLNRLLLIFGWSVFGHKINFIQMIIFVRHGERADQSPLSSERKAMEKDYDPHLT